MIKKSQQKYKYLKNEKSLKVKEKVFFINFKGISVARNCIRAGNAPLKQICFFLDILDEIRLVQSNEIIEVQRSDMVLKFIGDRAKKTKEMIKQALGKVLLLMKHIL